MNKVKSFFKLVRWTNLLIIAMMMCLVYYFVMAPLYAIGIAGVFPPSPSFLLLVISLVFIVAAGYVINDYYDVEMDKVNKPDKLIIGKIFTDKEAKFFYNVLSIIGLLTGLVSGIIALKSSFYIIFAMLLLLVCVLYSYSSTYKKKILVGNLIVSLSVAFAVFLPWLFEALYVSNHELILSVCRDKLVHNLPFVLIYVGFAFITTLLREIVKDAEDYNGDSLTRCRTIPIVCGLKNTKIIICVLFCVLYALLAYYHIIIISLQANIAMILLLFVEFMAVVSVVTLFQIKEFADFHRTSVFLKIQMVAGMLTMMFI